MNNETIGQRTKRLRETAGVRGPELARRAQISKGHLHEIEHDKCPRIGLEVSRRLARALGVTLNDFAGEVQSDPCRHGSAVYWNPYTGQVQCHRCGVVFVPEVGT